MNALEQLGFVKSVNEMNEIEYTYYFKSYDGRDDKKVIYFQEGLGIGDLEKYAVHFDNRFVWSTKQVAATLQVLAEMNEETDRSPRAMAFSKALRQELKRVKDEKRKQS